MVRILHVLDHSIPLQSGYTFRSRAILQEQRALGWETLQLTGPKHNLGKTLPAMEQVDGLDILMVKVIFQEMLGLEQLVQTVNLM